MELFRALAVLAELPGSEQARLGELLELPGRPTRRDYTELFEFQLWPYASVYVGQDGMLGGEALDRVAGFWRALHYPPPDEPDHVAALFGLYATLGDLQGVEPDAARQLLFHLARRALLWEHLLPWIMPFLVKVEELSGPFYGGWARMVREALLAEIESRGAFHDVPVHLRDGHPVPDPNVEGATAFIRGILAPARSGMILVRTDLERAARELGIGLRIGERRFVVEALLSQDPSGTLSWLAGESRAWAARHEEWGRGLGLTGHVWQGRARRTALLLEHLSRSSDVSTRAVGVDSNDAASSLQ